MKIIILGGGSIGGSVAKELSSEENDVVVIDNNDENLEPIKTVEGIQTIYGNGSSPKMLEKAGLDENSLLLCLTDSEETNLLASLIGKEKFNAGRVVCRLKGSEYKKIAEEIIPFVDFFINPEDLITEEIKSLLHHPGALEILDFAEGKIKLVSVYAKSSGVLVGRQVKELKDDLPEYETRIPALYRNEELLIPTGETIINEGDEVFFIADETTTIVASFKFCRECPKKILIFSFFNLSTFLLYKISLPCTLNPLPLIISARPLIPMPPIPIKYTLFIELKSINSLIF